MIDLSHLEDVPPPDEPEGGDWDESVASVHQFPTTPVGPVLPTLPGEFWAARPSLGHIRRAAHNRGRGADSVFHTVLARLAAIRSPKRSLDTGIGASTVSLNYFVAITGPSGSGKSSGIAVASPLLPFPLHVDCPDGIGLGSGEGLAEAYMGFVEEERVGGNGKPRYVKVRQQVRRNVFISVDEGQIMAQLGERKGTTLGPNLRSSWSGSAIGQANASEERNRHVPAGAYSLGLVMAFQPATIESLLADAAGGTPQRFTYVAAVDPAIPDEAPEWPGELPVDWGLIVPEERATMTLDPTIRAEMRRADLARNRGEVVVAELDSHRPLLGLKIAALLALLDGRAHVGSDDRDLAEIALATSDAVRDALLTHSAAQLAARKAEHEENVVRLAVRTVAEVGQVPRAVTRVAARLARIVHAGDGAPVGRSVLYRRTAARDRALFDAALDHAEGQNWLRVEGQAVAGGSSEPAS